MGKRLGILVTSNVHLDKTLGLCRAAKNKGDMDVMLFFTHTGTLLTQDSRFGELEGLAKIYLCKVGFENHGLIPPVTGVGKNGYATQALNGEMIEDCDRYVVF